MKRVVRKTQITNDASKEREQLKTRAHNATNTNDIE